MQSVCINVLMSIVGDCESTACKSSSDSGPRVLSEEIPKEVLPSDSGSMDSCVPALLALFKTDQTACGSSFDGR